MLRSTEADRASRGDLLRAPGGEEEMYPPHQGGAEEGVATRGLLTSPFFSPLLPNPNPRKTRDLPFTSRRSRISASIPDPAENSKVEYTPWLIVGLGNPDSKYHGSRHNCRYTGSKSNSMCTAEAEDDRSFGVKSICIMQPLR